MQSTPVLTGPQVVPRRTTVSVDGLNCHYDLPRAIEIVRKEVGKPIGIIDPSRERRFSNCIRRGRSHA